MEAYSLKAIFAADSSGFVSGISGILGSLSSAEGKLGSFQGKLGSIIKPLGIAGAAFGAIGGASIAAFKEVKAGEDILIKATGATGKEAEKLKDVYNDVADEVGGTWEQIAGTVGAVNVRFDASGEALKGLSKEFQTFANITGQDGKEAVMSVSSAMRLFDVDVKDTDAVLGLFAKTSQNTGRSAASLQDAVQNYAPTLKTLGLGLGESVSLLGAFDDEGLRSGEVLGRMQRAAANATEKGSDLRTELSRLSRELQNPETHAKAVGEAFDLFGKRGANSFIKLAEEGKLNFDNLSGDLSQFKGVVDKTASELGDGTKRMAKAWKSVQSALKPLGEQIMGVLAPIMEKLAGAIKVVGNVFKALPEGAKKVVVIGGLLTAALLPAIAIFGKIGKSVGGVVSKIKGLKKAKEGADSVEALGKAGESASGGLDVIKNAAAGLIKSLGKAVTIVAIAGSIYIVAQAFKLLADSSIKLAKQGGLAIGVMAGMVVALGALMVIASKVGAGMTVGAVGFLAFGAAILMASAGIALILAVLPPVIEALTNFATVVLPLVNQSLQIMSNFILSLVTILGTTLVDIINAIGSVIIGTIDAISSGVCNIVQTIGDTVVGIINAIGSTIIGIITAITTGVTSIIESVSSGISNIVQSVGDTISNIITSVGEGIKTTVEGICNGIKTVIEGIGKAISGVVDSIGNAISKIINSLANVVNALVDLGNGAIQNLANKGPAAAAAIGEIALALGGLRLAISADTLNEYGNGFVKMASGITSAGASASAIVSSVMALGAACTSATTAGIAAFNNLKTSADSMKSGLTSSFNAIKTSATSSFNAVKTAAMQGFNGIPQVARAAINGAIAAIQSGVSQMYSLGQMMSSGFASGMRSSLGDVESVAEKMADAAKKAVEAKAKIGSPSKVMAKLGKFMGQGFAKGIESTESLVRKASEFIVSIPTLDDFNVGGTVSMRMNDTSFSHLAEDIAQALDTRPVVVKADVNMDSYKVGELTTDSVTKTQIYNEKLSNFRQGIKYV